jgi:VWFA-related protein
LQGTVFCPAQSQEQLQDQASSGQSSYSFHTGTRVVLTDVTVTDSHGNPVHGLPQSAFRIFDNQQTQVIASFQEHAGIDPVTTQVAPVDGTYSNDFLLHLPSVLNILLIDTVNIDMAGQMYLSYELTKFLNEQPEGQPLAIYLRAGSGCFLVQNFTSDRKLLLNAVHKAIPRFPPRGREYLADLDTLHQMAFSLSQLSGRKNVLWFSGGSMRVLLPDAIESQNETGWRDLYDDLNKERIAIYPIDARGLILDDGFFSIAQQHMQMESMARATGGQAFYANNGLSEITEHVLDSSGSFYSLTYSPHDLHLDNKWHKVSVAVEGGSYHLSYRSGFFDDGSVSEQQQNSRPRTRLLWNGEKLQVSELRDRPIIFQASVQPDSYREIADSNMGSDSSYGIKKGSIPVLIRYTVPLDALTIRVIEGRHRISVGVSAIALDRDGSMVGHRFEQITMSLPDDIFRRRPDLPVVVDQQINLSQDEQFLQLGLWDTVTGRFGRIETPIEIPKFLQQPDATGHN